MNRMNVLAPGGPQRAQDLPNVPGAERVYTPLNSGLIRGVFTQLYQQVVAEIRESPKKRLSKLTQRVITEICKLGDNNLNERDVALPPGRVAVANVANIAPKERSFTLSQRVIVEICNLGNSLIVSAPAPNENLSKLSQGVIAEICGTPEKRLSKLTQQVVTLLAKQIILQLPQQKITEIRESQKEKTFKLVQEVIAKICSFVDGVSMILDAWGFKIAKDILDTLVNAVRFILHIIATGCMQRTLPKGNRSLKAYFCKKEEKDGLERQNIVIRRLVMFAASACQLIVRLAPELTYPRVLLKPFLWIGLILEIAELLSICKGSITGDLGQTIKNMLKIVVALSYSVISCAIFAMASTLGSTPLLPIALLGALFMFFSWLAAGGMKDPALILQSVDKIFLKYKLVNSIFSFIRSIYSDRNITDEGISRQRSLYLTGVGLKMCYSAASAIIKFVKDSQEILEINAAETMPQERKIHR